jgi:hypothetical protein
MSTFDIEVEYRPGPQHGNADGLSRPPVEPCDSRGCICVQAHDNISAHRCMAATDGEPDYESCPGVPTPKSKLIALITRSGRLIGDENEPELDSGVELSVEPDSDPWCGPEDDDLYPSNQIDPEAPIDDSLPVSPIEPEAPIGSLPSAGPGIELEAPLDESVLDEPNELDAPTRDVASIGSIEPPARPNTPIESDYSSDNMDDLTPIATWKGLLVSYARLLY